MKKIIDTKAFQKWYAQEWGILGNLEQSIMNWLEEQPDYTESKSPTPTPKTDSVHGVWMDKFKQEYELFAQFKKIKLEWNKTDAYSLDAIICVLLHKTDSDYQRALDGWKLILNQWDNLNPFLKDQTQLSQISKNIDEIIRKLSRHAKESTTKGLGKWA